MKKYLVIRMGFEGTPQTGIILIKTDQVHLSHRQHCDITEETTIHVLRHTF